MAWLLGHLAKRTIGPDKVNQLRHALFLRDADGVPRTCDRHRELLAPKFDAVERDPRRASWAAPGVATWTEPEGGYFVSLDVLDGMRPRGREPGGRRRASR